MKECKNCKKTISENEHDTYYGYCGDCYEMINDVLEEQRDLSGIMQD